MANSLRQFDIDDDSPEIAYFPFVNLQPSPNVTAGWQLLYTTSGAATNPGQVGVGTSYHYTSLNGASLMINWTGTGIDLLGSAANALYNISLDGASATYFEQAGSTILASFNGLANTNHSLLLTTIMNTTSPNVFLKFDKARVTYAPPLGFVNTTATSQTVADSAIAFMGSWSYMSDTTGNSMHVSNSAGDRIQTTFLGSAVTIYGLTSSYSGNFTVTLDNNTTNLSALSSYNNSNTLLFYATDLPQNTLHNITVTNQENRTFALRVGGVNITSFGNSTTTPPSPSSRVVIPAGTIAAAVLAAVLFLVVVGVLYYVCCVRRKARTADQPTFLQDRRKRSNDQDSADIERVPDTNPSSREELESTSLSTSKGYGFGLGLRRGFPFTHNKSKLGSSSSGRLQNAVAESHPMPTQYDRDDKRLSMSTLTEDLPRAPESEKLAPGWYNPVARTPPSFKYTRYKETRGILLPELHAGPMEPIDDADDDDTDVKTLTSRQDEALAATLSLSPRTSEAAAAFRGPPLPNPNVDEQPQTSQQPNFLEVRDMSPFRVDVAAIFGTRKSSRNSRTTSGSSSSWSKVRSRLYRKAHRDDGRPSYYTEKQESSGSSGPESVPVVMHESSSANPPSETAPGSGTYSFLDFTSSRVSLRQQSKTSTPSSAPAELGHGVRETSTWSENTSVRMVRIERSRDNMAAKPDAPSTASGGSPPSDNSGALTTQSAAQTPNTQRSLPFPFPITIPSSMHIAPTSPISPDSRYVPERHSTSSPLDTFSSNLYQYLQVPQIAPPELALSSASSPTESVPFSVSDIHFRHSFSDYATVDSQRASVASGLPPHPPLPHRDSSQGSTPTFSPPPPYIVQRVLGLPVSSLTPISPSAFIPVSRMTSGNSTSSTLSSAGRSGTSSSHLAPMRVSSLLGPRPRPSTPGSIRGSAAPQLPMQGGRSGSRNPR